MAVAQALESRVLVLTGGPGVGKTTVLRAILGILMAKGVRPLLAAPTGRAAKRMTEATGLEARTIHRLLEINPQDGRFRRRPGHPLDGDLLVVDESSMVDVVLMAHLLQAVPDAMGLLLVGDVDQLPSVGPGQVLADVIDSGRVPVARLTEIHRQSAESRIVLAAHAINAGEMPAFSQAGQGDCFFVEAEDAERALQLLLQVVSERIPQRFGLDPVRDVQVLCPMNRGGLGAQALNQSLQRLLNPHGTPAIERYGQRFAVGDKVMQIENDYDREVYNGDLGVVRSIGVEDETMSVEFDGRLVTFDFGDLDRLVLAYATTVHKAQGSEYPGGGDPGDDAALPDAAAAPALHRRHAWQAPRGPGGADPGARHRGARHAGPSSLVAAAHPAVGVNCRHVDPLRRRLLPRVRPGADRGGSHRQPRSASP